jgi:hypothetical protein
MYAYPRVKMKNLIRVLLTPSCWFRNYPTCPYVDDLVNSLLDHNQIQAVDRHSAVIGGRTIWISNFPYASGTIDEGSKCTGMPSRRTVFRLHDCISNKIALTGPSERA